MVNKALQPQGTLPDRIADELIARVFTGELQPGDTLPAERALAASLGVDRTSLRIAMRQLTRMRLIRVVRGSGMTVLDYRHHAGLDFLAAVLEIPGLQLGGAFLLEALEHWDGAMPRITARALARATPRDVRELDRLLSEQLVLLDRGATPEPVVELELTLHDALVDMVGDTTLRLIANSSRPLRRELSLLQMSLVDWRAHVERQRDQVRAILVAQPDEQRQREAHAAYMRQQHSALREHLATLPPNPSRSTRWSRQAA